MCWYRNMRTLTSTEINRRIGVCAFIAAGFAVSLAFPAESSYDTISTAERVDKLGATGVLAFGFLLSLGALCYLIRLQYGKMLQVLEKNAEAMTRLREHCEAVRGK